MTAHRIVIAEDQREVSRLLRTALETLESELEVVEIPSGEEAILDASRNPVDLLVTDYRLPGITGIDLMKKVRTYHPDAKVILITGLTDPAVRKAVARAGADAFFIKPVPVADFLDSVERHLGLVRTMLPGEPIADTDERGRDNLSDLLAGLRKNLKARAAILLNDRGHILARAGDLPNTSSEVSLLASLMAIYSAGQKVTYLLGEEGFSSWHIFEGGEFELIFAPVGRTHGMMVIGEALAAQGKILETMRIFSTARETIKQTLAAMGVTLSVTEAAEPPPIEEAPPKPDVRDIEPLLKEPKKKLKREEIDAFWDDAAKKKPVAPTERDFISYEQARQLGLTPKDNKG